MIGIDFQTAQKAKIDFDANSLKLQDGLTEEVMGKPDPTSLIKVKGNLVIPARENPS